MNYKVKHLFLKIPIHPPFPKGEKGIIIVLLKVLNNFGTQIFIGKKKPLQYALPGSLCTD